MNEIQLLREQLAAERRHVRSVASACAAACDRLAEPSSASALEPLLEASTLYLRSVLDWFDERDERLGGLYRDHPAGGLERRALAALGPGGIGREALERLAADEPSRETWAALAQFINGAWDARRSAIEALLASNARVADWRAFAGIDADSVYRERALYARVRSALPAGIELP